MCYLKSTSCWLILPAHETIHSEMLMVALLALPMGLASGSSEWMGCSSWLPQACDLPACEDCGGGPCGVLSTKQNPSVLSAVLTESISPLRQLFIGTDKGHFLTDSFYFRHKMFKTYLNGIYLWGAVCCFDTCIHCIMSYQVKYICLLRHLTFLYGKNIPNPIF